MSGPHHAAGDLLVGDAIGLRSILEIESAYGRLVYLASLRNSDSGRYEHFGLESDAGIDLDLSLRRLHEFVFREWVSYSLERKKADIELYISGLDSIDPADLVDAWLRMTPYKNLVPAAIRGPERKRHISDFEAILGLLKNVYGVASPDLDA